jgi:hypothetical protein
MGTPLLILGPQRHVKEDTMAKRGSRKGRRKYSTAAGKDVELAMREMKEGKLRSGRSGKKVTNPKQAIAIGLSEARRSGAKVPKAKPRKRR